MSKAELMNVLFKLYSIGGPFSTVGLRGQARPARSARLNLSLKFEPAG